MKNKVVEDSSFHIADTLPPDGETYNYTVEELREFVKCTQDPIHFIKTYMKIIQVDKGLVPFDMWDFQEEMVRSYHENRYNITMCSRQVGKALDINTPINTEKGWTTMQHVHPGDKVYTPEGKLTSVIAESPIFTEHETYTVKFDTGDVVTADENHLWSIERPIKLQIGHGRKIRKIITRHQTEVVTTKQLQVLVAKYPHIRIPTAQPLQYPHVNVLSDPYVLGVWLGDGSKDSARIIGARSDVNEYETQFNLVGYSLTENRLKGREHLRLVKIDTLHTQLNRMGVLNNKHIPPEYLRGDINQRLSLLQGLMDTDGNSNGCGGCQFYNKSKILIAGVRELLWSLGIKHRVGSKWIDGREYFGIQFSTQLPVFRLSRKLQLHIKTVGHPKATHWYVRAVEPNGRTPVKCISVEDSSHLFLCGKELIPTHNSTTVIGYFLYYILFNVNVNVCISANKQKTAVDLLGRLKLAYEHLPRFLQQGVVRWARLEVELSNGSRVFAAATSSSAVRGGSYNMLLLDEFAFVPENIANEFYASTFPTITSGKETKIIMVSTPNGMNLFHKFWLDAKEDHNDFKPLFVHWSQVPGRDDVWKEDTIRNIGGPEKFAQEYECVGPDTEITIQDPLLRTISKPSISNLYGSLVVPPAPSNFRENTRYEILTPTGFQPFSGIQLKTSTVREVYLSDGTSVVMTLEHRVLSSTGQWISVRELTSGVILQSTNSALVTVLHISEPYGECVFDPVDVGNGASYYSGSLISHNCSFLSTSYTLIRPQVLQTLTPIKPIYTQEDGYLEFVAPDPEHTYLMTVDTASGQGLDYSTFVIFDVGVMPYTVVATYANNRISTMEFPQTIMKYATRFHLPWLFIEVMDIGRDVAHIMFRDHEYPRFMSTSTDKRLGQRLTFNSRMNRHLGLRMTAGVKRSGCAVIKALIENRQLILNDYRIIKELSVFVQRSATYTAETGHHDDLVMPLVILGWVSLQPNFAEVTNTRALDSYQHIVAASQNDTTPIIIREDEPMPVGIFGPSDWDPDPSWLNR